MKKQTENWEKDLREKLASIEHTRWADWQKYLHSKLIIHKSGLIEMPEDLFKHWEQQISTDYKNLTEKEKDSDREQVDRYFYLIQKTRTEAKEDERQKLRGIIDKEIEKIEEEPDRLKLQEIFASGKIDALYFVLKSLTKKIK